MFSKPKLSCSSKRVNGCIVRSYEVRPKKVSKMLKDAFYFPFAQPFLIRPIQGCETLSSGLSCRSFFESFERFELSREVRKQVLERREFALKLRAEFKLDARASESKRAASPFFSAKK